MKELTLVVMAAGMGSRFGGLKQITPVDEDGNFLIDYSIYDAIRAGFQKVVFVIKEENYKIFYNTIGKRIENKIKVEYAFQKLESIPKEIKLPKSRNKPWGTLHAVLSAKEKVNGPFAVINADDFYGFQSYQIVTEFLNKNDKDNIAVPYPFSYVDSKFGFVKRGVFSFQNDNVKDILECSIGYEQNKVIAKPLNGQMPFEIKKEHPVSMNIFGFQNKVMKDFEIYFLNFLNQNKENLESIECFLPEFLKQALKEKKITLKYQISTAKWLGMTYKEDLDIVKQKLKELKEKGEYPTHLWQ